MSQEAATVDNAQVAQQEPGQPDQGGASEREQARAGAASAIRELLSSAEAAEGEEQEAPAEAEKPAKGAKAKAEPKEEPEAEAEVETKPEPPAERPLKPSELQEMRRRQRAIERRQAEVEERDRRFAEERQRFDQQMQREQAWEQELRRDPIAAVSKRLGVAPERLVAGFADGQTQKLDPLVAAELDRLRTDLQQEKKAREDRERQIKEHEDRQDLQRRIEADVNWFAELVPAQAAEHAPYYSALPAKEREMRAREAEMLAIKHDPDITRGEILQALEQRAMEIYESQHRNERLQKLRGGAAKVTDNGNGKPHGKPAPQGTRPGAREAAEPAGHGNGASTMEDRRRLAASSIREMQSKE